MLGKDITLYYFDVRVRGEIIRLILHSKGQKFNDHRISKSDWPAFKPKTPFGSLPVLEIDGEKFSQNMAICSFLSKELGLHGANNREAARIEEIQNMREDLLLAESKAERAKDEAQRAELSSALEKEIYPKFLDKFTQLIEANRQSVFVIGRDMTLADIVIFEGLESYFQRHPQNIDKYPAIKKLREAVAHSDGIRQYLATRKEYLI